MTNAEINDIDAVGAQLTGGSDIDNATSEFDMEKLFTLACMQVLKEQTSNDTKITNIARSWSPLKSALRVWMRSNVNPDTPTCYRVFISDIQKNEASVFRQAITQALVDYRPVLNTILATRAKQSGTTSPFKFQDSYSYTDDFEELTLPSGACVLLRFISRKTITDEKTRRI